MCRQLGRRSRGAELSREDTYQEVVNVNGPGRREVCNCGRFDAIQLGDFMVLVEDACLRLMCGSRGRHGDVVATSGMSVPEHVYGGLRSNSSRIGERLAPCCSAVNYDDSLKEWKEKEGLESAAS